jgi:hypothetical protein
MLTCGLFRLEHKIRECALVKTKTRGVPSSQCTTFMAMFTHDEEHDEHGFFTHVDGVYSAHLLRITLQNADVVEHACL